MTDVPATCCHCGSDIRYCADCGEPIPVQEAMRAAYLRGLEDAANVAENFGADQMCVKCSHPRSNHPFRHPFQPGPGDPLNVADAIRALAKEKRK